MAISRRRGAEAFALEADLALAAGFFALAAAAFTGLALALAGPALAAGFFALAATAFTGLGLALALGLAEAPLTAALLAAFEAKPSSTTAWAAARRAMGTR